MKVCQILISKDSHNILSDWIEYHFSLGIDHLFLVDNNSWENRYHIEDPRISVIPYHGFPVFHELPKEKGGEWRQCFLYCLVLRMAFDQDYDYAFISDDDEYLDLKEADLYKFLEKYKDYDSIGIPWEIITDSGYIYLDELPTDKKYYEIYTERWTQTDIEHNHVKSFFRIPKTLEDFDRLVTNNYGSQLMHCIGGEKVQILRTEASVRHIRTGCLEGFLKRKAFYGKENNWKLLNDSNHLNYFFSVNFPTKEKAQAYIKLCEKYALQISEDDKIILRKYGISI